MPDISQNFLRQLANLQKERSLDAVRLRQVHLQGYILALHEAELIDDAAKLQLEQLLELRVDQRLSALDETSEYGGPETMSLATPSLQEATVSWNQVHRSSNHPTERDRPGLLMARAALFRRQGQYGDAFSICDLLIEQIGLSCAEREPSYDDLLVAASEQDKL
ncbi:hypothetical protein PZT57_26625 [Pseudomonas aeruginosa]|uniref:hypothetical protein n=1 Tax=Pseudomonas aeruginosa TaxID=287 RepID=UPI002B27798C|nr:hypothetical protein [Pseudomonas aeruginosa]MEA8592225.1 hypothetical protein [Pseudomonas aeruginosa]